MHHVDIHVRDLAAVKRLFDALAPSLDLELRSEYPEFVSYWRRDKRPVIGFLLDDASGSGTARVALGAGTRAGVDAAAAAARRHGARAIEGPGIHAEYGDDYYAVFFEDGEGNKFEVVHDPEYA